MNNDNELTSEDMRIGDDLMLEGDYINAAIETWFDVDARFGTKTHGTDDYLNFYADYHPEGGRLEAYYANRTSGQSPLGYIGSDSANQQQETVCGSSLAVILMSDKLFSHANPPYPPCGSDWDMERTFHEMASYFSSAKPPEPRRML